MRSSNKDHVPGTEKKMSAALRRLVSGGLRVNALAYSLRQVQAASLPAASSWGKETRRVILASLQVARVFSGSSSRADMLIIDKTWQQRLVSTLVGIGQCFLAWI